MLKPKEMRSKESSLINPVIVEIITNLFVEPTTKLMTIDVNSIVITLHFLVGDVVDIPIQLVYVPQFTNQFVALIIKLIQTSVN